MSNRKWNGPDPGRGSGPVTTTRTKRPAPVEWETPPIHTMTARAQAIWGEAFALGYRYGHDDGYAAAEQHHWGPADVGTAVRSLQALGTLGIDRAERRRRREAS